MNKVILLVLLMPVTAFGQVKENFESGNLSGWIQSPEGHWNTDNTSPISGSLSLHHIFDNPDPGTDRIGMVVKDLHPDKGASLWSFKVRHGYDPSASNNWAVFLMSDTDPVSAQNNTPLNGYAVGVNQTGYDDTLRLWKVKGDVYSTVVNTGINWQSSIGTAGSVKVSIERSTSGEWNLKAYGMNDVLIGSGNGNDGELFSHGWFFVTYKYTSTRDRLLWLDDIIIDGIFYEDSDTGPPEDDFTSVKAGPGDIVISEIMADPSPAVSLPAKEYIEIHNRTEYPFSMENWRLSDGKTSCTFPKRIIHPGAYMILCQLQDTMLFNRYGMTTGLKSFPALTDGGKLLFITDGSANLIHGIEYSSDWYGDILKEGGGWSLEIIDTGYPFYQEGNWHASLSGEGGTPGNVNSVSGENPDNIFSGIENVFPDDSNTIRISLSETVISLDKNLNNVEIKGSKIIDISSLDPLMQNYTASLGEPIQHGIIYTLTAGDEVTDFAGNQMQRNEFRFGLPDRVQKGDILFNELLFNPFSGESDYIELYNPSERIIDASDLILVSVNDELNDTSSIVNVLNENRCILPRNYIVITTERQALLERFSASDPDNIFEVSYLPSMPDDKGHLILYDRGLEKIDEVTYDEGMHYSLLSGYEGISLEKIRINGLSADRSLWHSASQVSGWGTPGAPNSVLSEETESRGKVLFSSTRITPDNDGNEDFLVIDLALTGLGNIISVAVFDETGSFVRKIADNILAGPEASIVWNGTADDKKLVDTGIYILLITVFDDTGKIQKWKKVCTVIR